MSMSDPIADMLTRIRNGLQAQKISVGMPASFRANQSLKRLDVSVHRVVVYTPIKMIFPQYVKVWVWLLFLLLKEFLLIRLLVSMVSAGKFFALFSNSLTATDYYSRLTTTNTQGKAK